MFIKLNNICLSYPSGHSRVEVLKKISLCVSSGEMIAIIGSSGSGKSTLMNILGCLDKPDSGTYYLNGIDISTLESNDLAKLRREYFGFIFQRYHLLSHLTAVQNVEIPAIYTGIDRKKRFERAQLLLSRLGLKEQIYYKPFQLSGGQQQRVSIARSLMNNGQIILADEPTGALDRQSGEEVISILRQLCGQGHTVIIVTHDLKIANQAERVIEIQDGKIIGNSVPIRTHFNTKKNVSSFSYNKLDQFLSSFKESLTMAWLSMMTNKVRTLLTMLGIVIGITSVILIVIIGNAAKHLVLSDIRAIGTNTIDIYPGKDFGDVDSQYQRSLKYDDLEAIQKQSWVNSATPSISENLYVRSGNINVTANAYGVSDDYFAVYGMTFNEGSSFNIEQLTGRSQVVVLDSNSRRQLFPNKNNVIGEVILVGNMPAIVIGVVKDRQSVFGGNNKILRVWLPYTTISERMIGGQSWLNSITIRVMEGYNSVQAEQKLVQLLLLRHGKKDFFTWNMDGVLRTAEKTTRTLQIFLSLVAIISLIVGGIGVMNIMLVSVTERTKEIGIRMAVGAQAKDVLQQFLVEAVLICLVGGAIGTILSILISFSIHLFLPNWKINFSFITLFGTFLCSTFVGILSGWLPARNAARLDPVDALIRE